MAETVTLATILARLMLNGLTEAEAMNLPLSLGVTDGHLNFGTAKFFDTFPHTFNDHETGKPFAARLDGYLDLKVLREPAKERKK